MVENGAHLRSSCVEFMVGVHESIKQKYGKDVMDKMFSDDLRSTCKLQLKQAEASVKRVRILGKVVEREFAKTPTSSQEMPSLNGGRAFTRSVSGILISCVFVKSAHEYHLDVSLFIFALVCVVLNAGKSAYPYSTLRSGFKWPPDVDPTAREEHLSCTDFLQVFGTSYDAYRQLPLWKRQQLKKESSLF